MVTVATNKDVVRRLIEEAFGGRLDLFDELCVPELAEELRRWVAPFHAAFPDFRMDIVELVGEGEKVVGRFRCSGTHEGEWRGHAGTGRRFESVDEVYFFEFREGKIAATWSLEDTYARAQQLGFA